jgi:hypothetical protein
MRTLARDSNRCGKLWLTRRRLTRLMVTDLGGLSEFEGELICSWTRPALLWQIDLLWGFHGFVFRSRGMIKKCNLFRPNAATSVPGLYDPVEQPHLSRDALF